VALDTRRAVLDAILAADRDSYQELFLRLHSEKEQQRQRAEQAEATIRALREQLRLAEQAREKAERLQGSVTGGAAGNTRYPGA
jgi:ABC-type branched-subunit amino acid transport system ATPase component